MMQDITAIFEEFAETSVGRVRGEEDIALEIMLKRAGLDYSPGSPDLVDEYLSDVYDSMRPPTGWRRVFASKKIERTPELNHTILWGGAYVGEVLQRAEPAWSWIDYDDFLIKDPRAMKLLGPRDTLGPPRCW